MEDHHHISEKAKPPVQAHTARYLRRGGFRFF
jgi:hypothetical protein